MNDPLDLDIFSARQIAFTRAIDADGSDAALELIAGASQVASVASTMVGAFGLDALQRACFEAACRAGEDQYFTLSRDMLWSVLLMIKEQSKIGEKILKDPNYVKPVPGGRGEEIAAELLRRMDEED